MYCDKFAVMQCPRCLAPLCHDHRIGENKRCLECEQSFEQVVTQSYQQIQKRASSQKRSAMRAGTMGLGLGAFMTTIALIVPADSLLAAGVAILILPPALCWLVLPSLIASREKVLLAQVRDSERDMFLEEKEPRALPPQYK